MPPSRSGLLQSSHGSLAQLVEHRTFNPMVEGSNPSRPTIKSNFLPLIFQQKLIVGIFAVIHRKSFLLAKLHRLKIHLSVRQ
jgi:hypothetical protein